jgi:hypothetical protein
MKFWILYRLVKSVFFTAEGTRSLKFIQGSTKPKLFISLMPKPPSAPLKFAKKLPKLHETRKTSERV